MKDSRFYFLLGFMSAIMISMFIVSCTSPLEANDSDCGTSWNPCHVRIVD